MTEEQPLNTSNRIAQSVDFSLVTGGPFYSILRSLGLVRADHVTTRRTAAAVALIAWLTPALLAIAQLIVDPGYHSLGYFTDLSVPARFMIAIWAMIVTERYADSRFNILAEQFRETHLLSQDYLPRFEAAVDIANRRSSSTIVELLAAVAAFSIAGIGLTVAVSLAGSSWEGTLVDGQVELSWAGTAARYISSPLFIFLVLRWAWWFLVWTALLFRISRLPLNLIPSHPDRAAGLGFLAIYPSVFSGFAFALACVVSASVLKALAVDHSLPPLEKVWFGIAGWIVINLMVFLGPMLVFVRPLYAAREVAMIEYGRLATLRHLLVHRTLAGTTNDDDEAQASKLLSTSELNNAIQAIRDMGYTPVNRSAITQIVVAAGLPFLPVILTLVPLADVLKWAVGKIL